MQRLVHPSVKAFVALAERGTLAAAGEAVSRSPSAVSLQIAALEAALGRELFTRGARGMRPTAAGRLLLEHARALLATEARAQAELHGLALTGELRFGMPQDFAGSQLAATLTRFRRAHPGVKVSAVIERNGVITALAQRGELDLAMLIARRAPAGALTASTRRSHWFAGPGFAWRRSQPLPLVLLEAPCVYRDFALQALEREGLRWDIAFGTASVPAMWAAVKAGVGVTVRMDLGAPRGVWRADEALGLPAVPSTVLSVVRPKASRSDAVEVLAALVRDSLGRLGRLGPRAAAAASGGAAR